MTGPRRSNCLFWAVAMRLKKGGRIKFVYSPYWWLHFHVRWVSSHGNEFSYTHEDHPYLDSKNSSRAVVFEGEVVRH